MWKLTFSTQKLAIALVVAFGFIALNSMSIEAQPRSYSIDLLEVDIDVREDSSVQVTETLHYEFSGEFNGMFREIALESRENDARCAQDASSTCGGFDWLSIDEVRVNDELVDAGRYETEEVVRSGERRLRVQYRFDAENQRPVLLEQEKYIFSVSYTVWGSIGYFEDFDLFYWNAIFPDRDVMIDKAAIHIQYPGDVEVSEEYTTLLTLIPRNNYEVYYRGPRSRYEVKNIFPSQDFTIAQQIPKGLVEAPGELELEFGLFPDSVDLDIGNFSTVADRSNSTIKGVPAGPQRLEISAPGWRSKLIELEIPPGENVLVSADLEPTVTTTVKWTGIVFANLFCLLAAIVFPFFVLFKWHKNGRDAKRTRVIVPEFSPPDNIPPYLLGALKDASVDSVDITASIIDLAYRGYIKIAEIKNSASNKASDYRLTKLKSNEGLSKFEKRLFTALFPSKQESRTLAQIKTSFPSRISGIKAEGYKRLVKEDYFKKRPDLLRDKWLSRSISFAVIMGIASIVLLVQINVYTGLLLAISVGLFGSLVSFIMPARTLRGSEALAAVRGFKMYLETAEKHTLQNLTPDLFEKYLSYAMVFGIEKKWAEKFAGIHMSAPSWYQGDSLSTFNAAVLATQLRGFNSSAQTTVNYTPPSSSSSSGGGWSGGGGGGGGFSGGGGGGGGGGAW